MKSMADNSVDFMATSPPYPGVDNMWGELFSRENFDKAHEFLDTAWDECLRVLKPGCKMAINIANTMRRPYLPNVARIYQWANKKVEPVGEIIWDKGLGFGGTAWGSWRCPSDPSLSDQHEYILVFRKYGKRGRPETYEKIDRDDFMAWRNSIWKISPASATKIGHCAPFPEQIPLRLITMYTFRDELVLDPFMGSATTAIMCHGLYRKFVGIESNADYFNLACGRVEKSLLQPPLF